MKPYLFLLSDNHETMHQSHLMFRIKVAGRTIVMNGRHIAIGKTGRTGAIGIVLLLCAVAVLDDFPAIPKRMDLAVAAVIRRNTVGAVISRRRIHFTIRPC